MTTRARRVLPLLARALRSRSKVRRSLAISLTAGLLLGFIAAVPAAPGGISAQVHVATAPVANPGWLNRLNTWRANAGVSSLTENTTWSAGDYNHALYMVKNDLVTHYETPGVPYYTPEGDTAARNSNIYVSSSTSTTDDQAIDWWMQAPFHAMGLMDPRLAQTAFGSYRQVKSGWQMGAAVDTLRGNPFTGGQYPVYFPGNGTTEPLTTYGGYEFPDPLQACPGYSAPTGLPVFVQVGGNVATSAGPVHSFIGNGVSLAHCVIDSNSPSVGSGLTYRGGVIVIPQQPLQNGVTYVVALTVNGLTYTWSFSVGPFASACGAPAVSSISPASGGSSGGTSVTIKGCGFTGATAVKFGAAPATFTVNSATQITVTSPPGNGVVDVTVTSIGGTSAASAVDRFTYTGPSVTVTPASVGFGGQAPGTTSGAQAVTLHNNQLAVLNVSSVAVTGANAASYVKGTDGCTGIPVAANGTCTVQVSFRPGTFGSFPATLTFTDNGPTSSQSASLNGTGALDNQGHLYTLDGWGGVHADGAAPTLNPSEYWSGWNIARSLALFPDGSGGYTLDGWGGLHPVGNANSVSASGYWPGWDIARQVVLAPWSSKANPAGWVLDGWGGIHEFGGAPQLHNYAWWPGWDIARGLAILPDSTPSAVAGYTLDGWGGIHEFGGAPVITNATYWSGWDIGRGITLSANASKSNPAGWTVDGYGGVHPFGSAPAVSNFAYWPGWDIARGVVGWSGAGASGGWVLDGWGGLHPFGNAPNVASGGYWSGWDIAVSLAGGNVATGSRRRN